MKILIAIDNLGRGGCERRAVELMKGLLENGNYEISLVVFSNRIEYEEVYDMNIRLFKLPRKTKKDLKVFYKFFKVLKEAKPDLVHSWGDMASIYATPSTTLLGIKLLNGSVVNAPAQTGWKDPDYFRKRIVLPFCAKMIGNSHAGLRAFDIPESKALCVHNGFNFERLENLQDPVDIRERFGLKGKTIVGMMGAFADRKDYHTYLEAAKIVLDAGYDISFLAIGDGANRQKLEASVEKKYADRISFTGLQKDVESILQILDIGVLMTNSDVHGEGISNAILEYMASGKAVIATDGGGSPEIVEQDNTGYLVPAKSPKVVARCIMYLADHPEIAKEMGRKGRDRIETHFNLKDMTSKYIDIYSEVLGVNAEHEKSYGNAFQGKKLMA